MSIFDDDFDHIAFARLSDDNQRELASNTRSIVTMRSAVTERYLGPLIDNEAVPAQILVELLIELPGFLVSTRWSSQTLEPLWQAIRQRLDSEADRDAAYRRIWEALPERLRNGGLREELRGRLGY